MAAPRSRFSSSYRSTDARSATSTPTPTFKPPISLPKRLLFPQLPVGSELPPLLAANNRELNAELYEFIALALRGFVNPWWTKITRYDKEFLPEITRILTIVVRSLEERLAAADLPSLVFRDIPVIISQHYADYRNASAKVGTSYATGGSVTLPLIFHQMQPHMAVSADGQWDETYIRQGVEHVLKFCLPTADWEAEAERTIVREIVAKVILGNVLSKLSQPWLIHKIILDLLGPPPETRTKPPDPPHQQGHAPRRPTLESIIVFFLSAIQTISGLCLAAIALSQKALHAVRVIPPATDSHRTNLAGPVVNMMAEILTMRSRSSSSSILSLVELGIGFSRSFIDRALPHVLYNHMIPARRITKIVVQGKKTLFPNGYPSPTPPDPTMEEQLVLRERLEIRLVTLFPSFPSSLLLGPDVATRRKTVSNAIDPLSSTECNVHLLILLFDVVLLTLFPEMGIAGASASTDSPDYTEEILDDSPII